MVEKTCVVCQTVFEVKASRAKTAKTCSDKCRGVLQAERYAKARPILICAGCGSKFQVKAYRANTVKYCSAECKKKANRIERNCEVCGTSFWFYKSQQAESRKHCSKECHRIAQNEGEIPPSLTCEICGSQYTRKKSEVENSRFCSAKCLDESKRRQVEKECECCHKTFSVNAHRSISARFCSEECKWKHFTGDDEWQSPDGKNREGYKRVGSNGLEHREVMLQWLLEESPDHHFLIVVDGEKKLDPSIDVHHIDRNRTNNVRSNLIAMPREVHSLLHHTRKRPENWDCWPENPETF